jgi:competence protein ComEA
LRGADQAGVAILVAAGLTAAVGWWVAQGGLQGRLIEVEHARPQTAAFQVDINQAAWPELVQLPGVGRSLAQRIVEYRGAHGGRFLDNDDLRRVHGIGPKTLENIRPYLRPMPASRAVAGP